MRTFSIEENLEIIGLHPQEEDMEVVILQSTRSSLVTEDFPTHMEVIVE